MLLTRAAVICFYWLFLSLFLCTSFFCIVLKYLFFLKNDALINNLYLHCTFMNYDPALYFLWALWTFFFFLTLSANCFMSHSLNALVHSHLSHQHHLHSLCTKALFNLYSYVQHTVFNWADYYCQTMYSCCEPEDDVIWWCRLQKHKHNINQHDLTDMSLSQQVSKFCHRK